MYPRVLDKSTRFYDISYDEFRGDDSSVDFLKYFRIQASSNQCNLAILDPVNSFLKMNFLGIISRPVPVIVAGLRQA